MYIPKSSCLITALLITLFATSCITSGKLTYLQHEGEAADTVKAFQSTDYKVQPYDNLFIKVVTPDPQWSQMFNATDATSGVSNMSEQSADLISYAVDNEGNIEFPFAGKFRVEGLTLKAVKAQIETTLKAYVTDASVTVKMVNNYVSIIGEVKTPGKYQIYKDRMNIFQALAMAGDLGDYSNRQKIQIIRQVGNNNIVSEFSLLDRSILTSEFYYVQPNDIIYAEPLKGRFFQLNAFPYGVILSTVTTFILILNVLR